MGSCALQRARSGALPSGATLRVAMGSPWAAGDSPFSARRRSLEPTSPARAVESGRCSGAASQAQRRPHPYHPAGSPIAREREIYLQWRRSAARRVRKASRRGRGSRTKQTAQTRPRSRRQETSRRGPGILLLLPELFARRPICGRLREAPNPSGLVPIPTAARAPKFAEADEGAAYCPRSLYWLLCRFPYRAGIFI